MPEELKKHTLTITRKGTSDEFITRIDGREVDQHGNLIISRGQGLPSQNKPEPEKKEKEKAKSKSPHEADVGILPLEKKTEPPPKTTTSRPREEPKNSPLRPKTKTKIEQKVVGGGPAPTETWSTAVKVDKEEAERQAQQALKQYKKTDWITYTDVEGRKHTGHPQDIKKYVEKDIIKVEEARAGKLFEVARGRGTGPAKKTVITKTTSKKKLPEVPRRKIIRQTFIDSEKTGVKRKPAIDIQYISFSEIPKALKPGKEKYAAKEFVKGVAVGGYSTVASPLIIAETAAKYCYQYPQHLVSGIPPEHLKQIMVGVVTSTAKHAAENPLYFIGEVVGSVAAGYAISKVAGAAQKAFTKYKLEQAGPQAVNVVTVVDKVKTRGGYTTTRSTSRLLTRIDDTPYSGVAVSTSKTAQFKPSQMILSKKGVKFRYAIPAQGSKYYATASEGVAWTQTPQTFSAYPTLTQANTVTQTGKNVLGQELTARSAGVSTATSKPAYTTQVMQYGQQSRAIKTGPNQWFGYTKVKEGGKHVADVFETQFIKTGKTGRSGSVVVNVGTSTSGLSTPPPTGVATGAVKDWLKSAKQAHVSLTTQRAIMQAGRSTGVLAAVDSLATSKKAKSAELSKEIVEVGFKAKTSTVRARGQASERLKTRASNLMLYSAKNRLTREERSARTGTSTRQKTTPKTRIETSTGTKTRIDTKEDKRQDYDTGTGFKWDVGQKTGTSTRTGTSTTSTTSTTTTPTPKITTITPRKPDLGKTRGPFLPPFKPKPKSFFAKKKLKLRPSRSKSRSDITPLADILSVAVSQARFGKATHPRPTEKRKREFITGFRRGRLRYPTLELEKEEKDKKKKKWSFFKKSSKKKRRLKLL